MKMMMTGGILAVVLDGAVTGLSRADFDREDPWETRKTIGMVVNTGLKMKSSVRPAYATA